MTDADGIVTLAQSYMPYGDLLSSAGSAASSYGFTGEWTDPSGLVYLRARYYDPSMGRFLTRDPWEGDYNSPMSYNPWLYGYGNPVNWTDPSGMYATGFEPCDLLPPEDRQWCTWGCKGRKPLPLPRWQPVGIMNLSAYYITHESQYFSGSGSKVGPIPKLGDIYSNKYFLFSSAGVCMQGSGKLKDGNYVGCHTKLNWSEPREIPVLGGGWSYLMPPDDKTNRDYTVFYPKTKADFGHVEAFETVAVCESGKIPRDLDGRIEIRINNSTFENIMKNNDVDNIFRVTDVGRGLCKTNGIDIFLGEQPPYPEVPYNNFYNSLVSPIIGINAALVEWRDLR